MEEEQCLAFTMGRVMYKGLEEEQCVPLNAVHLFL